MSVCFCKVRRAGDGLYITRGGAVFADDPHNRENISPPLTWGGHRGLVVGVFDSGQFGFRICLVSEHFGFPPGVYDWINIKYWPWYVQPCLCDWAYKRSVPLIEKSRALCPGGRFPFSFIHQVIIITGLNKSCSRPEDGLRCRQGGKTCTPPNFLSSVSLRLS